MIINGLATSRRTLPRGRKTSGAYDSSIGWYDRLNSSKAPDLRPVFCTGHLSRAREARELDQKGGLKSTTVLQCQREGLATNTMDPILRWNLPRVLAQFHLSQSLVRLRVLRAKGENNMDLSLCRSFIYSVQQSIKDVCFPRGRERMWTCLKQKAENTIVYTFPLFTSVLPTLGNPLQLDPLPLSLITCTRGWTFLLSHFLTSQNCTNNFQTSKPLLGTQSPLSTKELKISVIIAFFSTNI